MDSITYYNSIGKSYEKLYLREQESKIRFLLSRIKVKDSDKILDVGAGTGILESILLENDITALEPSDMADEIVKKGFRNVSVVKKRIQDFVSNEKFDVLFCITVLQDIEEKDRKSIIKKMFDLTAQNGHLLISVLKHSNIDLSSLNPIESGYVENDRYFIFFNDGKSFLS
ncbi:MAG: class I SAM-dependent methyltransferase [Candidatus Parvarchaeum sp.]